MDIIADYMEHVKFRHTLNERKESILLYRRLQIDGIQLIWTVQTSKQWSLIVHDPQDSPLTKNVLGKKHVHTRMSLSILSREEHEKRIMAWKRSAGHFRRPLVGILGIWGVPLWPSYVFYVFANP